MFYYNFSALCTKKGVRESRAAEDNGLNRAAVSKWKKGAVPTAATAQKLAAYFGVSVDALLGGEEPALTFDSFTYALADEARDLTPADKELLLSMARQLKQARKQKE